MSRPRLAFVLETALGWKTYAAQLETVISQRDDIETLIVPVGTTRFEALFWRRNNMGALDRLFRHRDPIDAYAGGSGKSVLRALRAFIPDAVHFAAHWPSAAMTGPLADVPFSVTLDHTREGIERDLPRGAWSRAHMAREAELLRRASHVYPMSHWTARSLEEDCGIDRSRITVMPPSIDLGRFKAHQGSREAVLNIVFIGNDFRRKGGDRLVSWITGPLAGKAHLHIVSTDPDARVDAVGVTCHGRVPNDTLVSELLPAMDVLCLPTLSDMSPQVLVEAAAAGLPSVASDIAGIPDIVLDGQTGFLVPAGDDDAFVAALDKLRSDPDLRSAMSAASVEHAADCFDAGNNFNSLINTLAKLA